MVTATRKTAAKAAEERAKFKNIFRSVVTGLSHSDYAMFASEIDTGVELELERDKGNAHDNWAIKINFEGEQIGWVPRGNEILARLIDAGFDVRVKVISHDRALPLDKRLYVAYYIHSA
jgi:hypothetical protein